MEAISIAIGGGMFKVIIVLLSELMCSPLKEEKEERMFFRQMICSSSP